MLQRSLTAWSYSIQPCLILLTSRNRVIALHSDLQFSHGICPSCLERVMREETDATPIE